MRAEMVTGLPFWPRSTARQVGDDGRPRKVISVEGSRRSQLRPSEPRDTSSSPLLIDTIGGAQLSSAHHDSIDSTVRAPAPTTASLPPSETAQKIAMTAPTEKTVKSAPKRYRSRLPGRNSMNRGIGSPGVPCRPLAGAERLDGDVGRGWPAGAGAVAESAAEAPAT